MKYDLSLLLCIGWNTLLISCILPFISTSISHFTRHGKLSRSISAEKQTYVQTFTVPKSYFIHFYLLGLICLGGFLISECCDLCHHSLCRGRCRNSEAFLCALLFEMHLLRRVIECRHIHHWGNSRMHVIAYIVGLLHYIFATLTFVSTSISTSPVTTQYESLTFKPVQIFGICTFLVSNIYQTAAHMHLSSLKKRDKSISYQIPSAGMFHLISCPHYFFEILIYLSFALITCGKFPEILLMFLWVAVNLSINARNMHLWYHQNFQNYPKSRKGLFPVLW